MTTPAYTPGSIRVTREAVYALLPGIDTKIIKRIQQWRDSVEPGACVTVFQMLTYDVTCNCPSDAWQHTKKCAGFSHGMPLELVMDHLFPPDGTPCAIEGIALHTMHGPLLEFGLGRARFIEKVGP